MVEKKKKQNQNIRQKEECPLCEISEETIKRLKEKGKDGKLKEEPRNNGE